MRRRGMGAPRKSRPGWGGRGWPPGSQSVWSEHYTGSVPTQEEDRREGTQEVRKTPAVLSHTRIA